MKPLILFATLVCALCSWTFAQDLRVGIILSQSGQAAAQGQAQLAAAEALQRAWQADPVGRRIEFIVKDDGSSPLAASRLAQQLTNDNEVHVLICCSSVAATRSVVLSGLNVLTVSPSALDATTKSNWLFSSRPDVQRLLQVALLRFSAEGKPTVALMTPDNDFGNDVVSALSALLVKDGIALNEVNRYPADAAVLTPEALWVATRQPAAVLVWGAARDSQLAYEGLRQRGYSGDVLLNPILLDDHSSLNSLDAALFPVSPLQMATELTEAHPSFMAVSRYQQHAIGADPYMYDALHLVRGALEQALVYGVSPDSVRAFRSAARDAFITVGRVPGVTAVFNYSEADHLGIDPYSLLIAQWQNGALRVRP